MEGYQVLQVDTFDEMLEIRDTIQSPILMNENNDQTRSQFIIPTPTKLLYVFEIKVEGYDAMYKVSKDQNNFEDAPFIEDTKEINSYEEDSVKFVEEHIPEEIKVIEREDDEDTNSSYVNSLNYSFEAKLTLAEEYTKEFYFDLAKYCKEYGVKISRSWKKERIYLGRNLFGILTFKGKTLCVGLPLNPKEYINSKYRFLDMSQYKKYQETPFLIKLTSGLKVRQTIELLEELFKKANLENKKLTFSFKKLPKKSKNTLIKENLIKIENTSIKL
jgi:hypothetical protein